MSGELSGQELNKKAVEILKKHLKTKGVDFEEYTKERTAMMKRLKEINSWMRSAPAVVAETKQVDLVSRKEAATSQAKAPIPELMLPTDAKEILLPCRFCCPITFESLMKALAERLRRLTVTIDDPRHPGDYWNTCGEFAMVDVHIRNNSGIPWHDVVLRLDVLGDATPYQIFGMYDNTAVWPTLNPGESRSFWVGVRSNDLPPGVMGSCTLVARVWGEPVLYAHVANSASREETLWPTYL